MARLEGGCLWAGREGGSPQGCAPVAAGTCVASVLGAEITGEPAMLAMGCVVEVMEVMPEGRQMSRLEQREAIT